jgi:hypothetical protein
MKQKKEPAMKSKKLWLDICLIVAITAIAVIFSPRRSPSPASGKPVVRFAALYPMTGDAAIYGQTNKKIINRMLADWERDNPKAKYKYQIHFEDVQLSTQKAAAGDKIIKKEHLGTIDSDGCFENDSGRRCADALRYPRNQKRRPGRDKGITC